MNLPPPLRARLAAAYPEWPFPADSASAAAAVELPTVVVESGTVLFTADSPCIGFPLVLQGEVQIARGSPGGRTLELYRVGPGDLCVVSAAALFGHARMPANGIATQRTELLVLDAATFESWTAHEPFRRHVFALFAGRLADLMVLAEAVAFQRLDQRLAAALLGHGRIVHLTHQGLADELGTVREIVSRLLRRFERRGWLVLQRERIELLDAAALRDAAAGGGLAELR